MSAHTLLAILASLSVARLQDTPGEPPEVAAPQAPKAQATEPQGVDPGLQELPSPVEEPFEEGRATEPKSGTIAARGDGASRTVRWQEGHTFPVRVPIAAPDREYMTTLWFPETRIASAISGWDDSSTLTATAKGNLLFLKLTGPGKSNGHLQVIGGSGRHYLLAIEGVPTGADEPTWDTYLKFTLPLTMDVEPPSPRGNTGTADSSPVIQLLRAMRLGTRLRGARILRADGEVALSTDNLVARLAYVYQASTLAGHVYEVTNLTDTPLAIDVTRLRTDGDASPRLVVSALRENVVHAYGTTRLYMVFFGKRN